MSGKLDTVIIGGGQAGLSISYYLKKQGREHVILEKNRVGESWCSKKWDSFTLVTPNRQMRLPGHEYAGEDPEGFMRRDEVVRYLDEYVDVFNPPLRLGVEATEVTENGHGSGYLIETSAGRLEAPNVVVATGTFQRPKIPTFGQDLSASVTQCHSSRYRNPEGLPPGGVLVVGGAQSGCQIAEELHQSGRQVYLCTSAVGRVPRRYRSKDFTWWLVNMGVVAEAVDSLDSLAERFDPNPHVSGRDGGHTLNLHQFARDGVVLLGRLEDARGYKIKLGGDLKENLTKADESAAELKRGVDKFIEKAGIDAPEPRDEPELQAGYEAEIVRELDLAQADVRTVIWATGHNCDFSWVKFPIFDEFGYPVQNRGVTSRPGLYFLGLHWLHTLKSGLFLGVGEEAAHIAGHIEANG